MADFCDRQHPTQIPHTGFDYGAIDRANGWLEEGELEAEAFEAARAIIGAAMGDILGWLIDPDGAGLRSNEVGVKAIVAVHELRPDLLRNRSLAAIARDIGCTKANLSYHAVRMRDTIGRLTTVGFSDEIRALHARRARAVHQGKWQTPEARQLRTKREQ